MCIVYFRWGEGVYECSGCLYVFVECVYGVCLLSLWGCVCVCVMSVCVCVVCLCVRLEGRTNKINIPGGQGDPTGPHETVRVRPVEVLRPLHPLQAVGEHEGGYERYPPLGSPPAGADAAGGGGDQAGGAGRRRGKGERGNLRRGGGEDEAAEETELKASNPSDG